MNPAIPEFKITTSSEGAVNPGSMVKGSITLHVPKGWHVYAPDGHKYKPFKVTYLDGQLADVKFTFPKPAVVEILGEKVPVYDADVVVGYEGRVKEGSPTGKPVLRATVSWQACSDTICLPPERRELEIELK